MRLHSALLAAVLSTCVSAHADSLISYSVSGMLIGDTSPTFSGSLTFDQTTDSVSAIDFTLVHSSSVYSFTSISSQGTGTDSSGAEFYHLITQSADGSDPTIGLYFWLTGAKAFDIASSTNSLRTPVATYSSVGGLGGATEYVKSGDVPCHPRPPNLPA